jgi:NAD(P)-dependent dehydrogenase (short-subunit alcohol dehydrogenase family)
MAMSAGNAVLVTGAAKGIGRATAQAFAEAGARVGLLDCDAATLDPLVEDMRRSGHDALGVVGDVASSAAVNHAVATIAQQLGKLDTLVANAGISFARRIDEYTDDEWDRILGVNLNGAFYTIRAALPHLEKTKGTIVLVSSMTGLVGQPHGAAYDASKGALIAMTRSLALELAPAGIRVNCVCPAGVDTPLMRAWAQTLPDPRAVLQQQAEMHLLKRMATAEEIAAAILFLASPAASFITGIALPIDGGATLGYRRC